MKRWKAGSTVNPGFYWSARGWEIVTVSEEPQALPGADGDRYVRIPTLAMLALAPLMGAAFAMFLPFVGFAMVFRELGRRLARPVRAALASRKAKGAPAASPHEHRPAA